MPAMAIHLIARRQLNVHPVPGTEGEWESGDWVVAAETAERLVGHSIYLHETRAAASYFGGKILSFRVVEDGDAAGRTVFRFRFDAAHRGVTTSRGGWAQEMKITE
jgi:hypothetical protein